MAEVDRVAALSDRLLRAGAKPRLARTNIHEALERVAALIAAEPSAPRSAAITIRACRRSTPTPIDCSRRCSISRATRSKPARESLTLRTRAEHAARIGERTLRLALRIDVGDDGRGVPADLADTLFEPLVSGRADGSGLGLAIAREIAREHGGDLGYASRPGATVFTLLLPVSDDGARG